MRAIVETALPSVPRDLSKASHQITLAEDGQKAIDAHLANSFDVILMDIRMPEVDGIEATQQIRQLRNGKSDIPIIAVTADAMRDTLDEYLNSGMNAVSTKPFNWPSLLMTINQVLNEEIHIVVDET